MNLVARIVTAALVTSTLSVAAVLSDPPFDNQLVTVSCDANSSVVVGWTDSSGNPAQDTVYDTNGDGKVESAVPDYVTEVTITKISDGRILQYTHKLKKATATQQQAGTAQPIQ